MQGSTPHHTNRLVHETSPYLLQHAHNPVDWYPWGPEALRKARAEDRLILLSIGYSACHWCHVMERESFENDRIAALMNQDFVNVKVDREERPDLDDIYMAATVTMNQGQGGWPMTVFLTPDLEPVFAGTYYPPDDRYGRPGFPRLLEAVSKAWQEDRENVRSRANQFARQLGESRTTSIEMAVGLDELRSAAQQFAQEFDARHGGFGPAPKFPPAAGIMLLLRLHRRLGDRHLAEMATRTLHAMSSGGMFDHIGGGFCRYSTDARWLVPHFEKMLYDNALLTKAYLEAFQATGDPEFRRVAVETLDYVLRDMTSPEGGFYSSTDADSEGVEGKFFVWTTEEVDALLSERDAEAVKYYFDISEHGNWEGTNIPNTPNPIEVVASRIKTTPEDLRERLDEARAILFAAREERVKPGLDDKVLTAWNGLMIGALAEGYRVSREPRYLAAAKRAAEFLSSQLTRADGGLLRTYRDGRAHLNAYLEDYAYLAEGLLDLYECDGDRRYFDRAVNLLHIVKAEFEDENTGAFYHTADSHEQLLFRYREGTDGAVPNPNAVAAISMARVGAHLGDDTWRERAIRAIHAYGGHIARYPRAFAKSLILVEWLLESPVELVFAGDEETHGLEQLQRAAARVFMPNRVQAIASPSTPGDGLPLLEGKGLVGGNAALYICREFTCAAPITDAEAAEETLRSLPVGRDPVRG